jgi:serine/alanine adding enzyme
MHLLRVDASLEKRWDDYVGQRTSTISDLSGWRHVVRNTYGINSHYFAVEDNGTLTGALALFEIKHPLFGHYLTTAPFSTDGGLHYDSDVARDLLIKEAKGLADKLQVDYLLLRTRGLQIEGFEQDQHYRTAVLDIQVDVDAVWTKTIRGKTRNQVRRGGKEGFTVHTGHDQLSDFCRVFHTHMRDLGSPAHSKAFYQNIIKFLGERAQFIVVREGKSLVGGALLFEINGTAMNLHTVSLMKYNRRCPNYLLYWDMIKGACERGNTRFDMGRSEADSSNLKFKQNWGTKIVELNYNYYLRNLKEIPYVDPRNPRYQLPIAVWKKLPLPVTGIFGPWLIKGLA